MKQILTHLIYEQAINVMFDAFIQNLGTDTSDTYKIGQCFDYVTRMYTADEYGSETGMYQHKNTTYILISYQNVRIVNIDNEFIWIQYTYRSCTKYIKNGHEPFEILSNNGGDVCMRINELNRHWQIT